MQKIKKLGDGLNAYTFSFAESALEDMRTSFNENVKSYFSHTEKSVVLEGGKFIAAEKISGDRHNYHMCSYGEYPLFWVSCDNRDTYDLFLNYFNALDISDDVLKLVDCDEKVMVYCGFFVVGNRAPAPAWHADYHPNANAYTLITPLFDVHPEHGDLLYYDSDQKVSRYHYKKNEAIIFGEGFLHTTEPYEKTENLRVLLSMTFGTDKMQYWDILKKSVGTQSEFMILPNGQPLNQWQSYRVTPR